MIYLASPLFTAIERGRNLRLASLLEAEGIEVFMPQKIEPKFDGKDLDFKPVFIGCKKGIDECDAMIALVDGLEIDSGVAWEIGYAYANQKPILCFRTDCRFADHNPLNVMIQYGASGVIDVSGYMKTEEEVLEKIFHETILWMASIANKNLLG